MRQHGGAWQRIDDLRNEGQTYAAIGAAFTGHLGLTGTSGPGVALKSKFIGLAVMTELPIVIVDVQRGGPSTGLPTKTEQFVPDPTTNDWIKLIGWFIENLYGSISNKSKGQTHQFLLATRKVSDQLFAEWFKL